MLNALRHDIQSRADEQLNCSTVLEGTSGTTKREGVEITFGQERVFCIQLMSDIFGCMIEKYLLTGALTVIWRDLELTFASTDESVVCTKANKL